MEIDLETNNLCFYRPSIIIKFIADTHKAAYSAHAEDLCPSIWSRIHSISFLFSIFLHFDFFFWFFFSDAQPKIQMDSSNRKQKTLTDRKRWIRGINQMFTFIWNIIFNNLKHRHKHRSLVRILRDRNKRDIEMKMGDERAKAS